MWSPLGSAAVGCTKYATGTASPQALPSARRLGRTYTRPVIETAAGGFLSLGQPTARRIARRRRECDRSHAARPRPGRLGQGAPSSTTCWRSPSAPTPTRADGPATPAAGCRDARARSHPDLVDRLTGAWRERRSTGESIVAVARRWLLEAAGAPVVAARRVVLIEHADRAERADAERAAQGARGADRSPRVHPRRRRAGPAASHDSVALPADPDRPRAARRSWSPT